MLSAIHNFGQEAILLVGKIWDGMVASPKEYQTLIGGTLALTGVLLTIAFSGRRVSRQLKHATELNDKNAERELTERRQSIRGAMFAEVLSIQDFLRDELHQARRYLNPNWTVVDETETTNATTSPPEMDEDAAAIAEYPFAMPDRDTVYQGLVGQISYLKQDEVRQIISIYNQYYKFRSWIFENDCSDARREDFAKIPPEKVKDLIGEIQNTLGSIDLIFAHMN